VRSVSATRKLRHGSGPAYTVRRAGTRAPGKRTISGSRRVASRGTASRIFAHVTGALSFNRPFALLGGSLLLAALIAAIWVGGHRVLAGASRSASSLAANAGFGISAIHLSGNRYSAPGVILRSLGFGPGQSIFAANVQTARDRLSKLDWVADAQVTRRYPDSIYVRIVEKTPFAVWSSASGVAVVDRLGHPITRVDPSRFSNLPLFVGDRPEGASDLVDSIKTHHAISARVRAMQRVSGRRWNLILDDGVLVKLPEQNWSQQLDALERLIVDKGILERDIAEIDLRSPDNYFFVLRNAVRRRVARGSRA